MEARVSNLFNCNIFFIQPREAVYQNFISLQYLQQPQQQNLVKIYESAYMRGCIYWVLAIIQ